MHKGLVHPCINYALLFFSMSPINSHKGLVSKVFGFINFFFFFLHILPFRLVISSIILSSYLHNFPSPLFNIKLPTTSFALHSCPSSVHLSKGSSIIVKLLLSIQFSCYPKIYSFPINKIDVLLEGLGKVGG